MRKTLSLLAMLLLCSIIAWSQTKTLTGRVTNEIGDPIPFATIKIKGSTAGVAADQDGNFSIMVSPDAILTVSAAGFQSEDIAVGDQNTLSVTLVSASSLQEVVVTALGISREKKALGYATQAVKGDELVQAANTGFAGALQGKVSGVQITPSSGMPGASSLITIRGARSFTGNNTPLYVIDGMPVSSDADISTGFSVTGTDIANRAVDIDPNDIASIDILKGQAASALYGIRASNGVIVITTKSGKGIPKGKARITFNTSVSLDELSRYPDLQTTYAQGTGGNYNPTASTSFGPKIADLPDNPTYGGNTTNANTDRDGMHPGQYYVPQRAQAGLDPWVTPQVYNNIKAFFNTGVIYNNSISILNATENGSYALSLGSANQKGIVPHTGMNRYNAKLAGETKLSSHFKATFNGNFINSDIDKMPSANDGIIATVYPAPPSYDLKGIPNHAEGDIYTPVGYRGGSFVNPFWGTEHNTFNEKTNRFFGNTSVSYFTDLSDRSKLDVKYQIGVDAYTTNYQDIWSYGSPSRNSSIEEYSYTNTTLNSLLTANFKWDINNDFSLNALVGNEIVNTNTKYVYAFGQDFAFAGWNHMDNTGVKDATESSTRRRTIGNFANVSLSYLQMLYLSVTGRQDIVSSMPSNNRTFYYPSASLGFVFTELEGLNGNSFLSFGKLRFSIAQVGQAGDYLQNYYTVPAYSGGFYLITPILYPINGTKAYIPSTLIYDANLKPQNTTSYEVGADLNFFNNLIELNYTYSRQNVKDQIFDVPLPGSTGASSYRTNGGKIHTNAHEATININAIRQSNLEWSIGANFSKIDNYVDELAPGVESIFLGGFVTPQVRAGIGDKFPVIYGTTYLRNEQGQVVVGNDGIPLTGAPGVIASASPDFILGANTRLRYKMLTLTAVTDWKQGGQMYSGTTGLFGNYGVSKETAEARDKNAAMFEGAVKEDGKPNDIVISGAPAIQAYYAALNSIDESSIVNASFMKLRELALRVQAIKKENFGLSVSFFTRNILLWTNSPQLDPESSQGNNNMAGSFERFTLPQTKSFGMGLNIQF
ncbi:SusC/RagA family TonB-linked outer membrane protein [Agriterribacter sp.]|uniref:SusC/RagA family TonB-linked outer membrane protein n=1 Tax=Agriterribacter sp. TaxID=2821509 RepID=UPI002CF32444|nr:SusC/RagA family TonB-linked outer membrane protein [Agriterribacter sp.]HRP56877.1 SusC/RagA family TonB-linked outer membrane protein [Agriterribacter sp.]